jgi:hypothetical protein
MITLVPLKYDCRMNKMKLNYNLQLLPRRKYWNLSLLLPLLDLKQEKLFHNQLEHNLPLGLLFQIRAVQLSLLFCTKMR